MSSALETAYSKTCLKRSLKIDKTKLLTTNGSLIFRFLGAVQNCLIYTEGRVCVCEGLVFSTQIDLKGSLTWIYSIPTFFLRELQNLESMNP